jgi:hypothetical protein
MCACASSLQRTPDHFFGPPHRPARRQPGKLRPGDHRGQDDAGANRGNGAVSDVAAGRRVGRTAVGELGQGALGSIFSIGVSTGP